MSKLYKSSYKYDQREGENMTAELQFLAVGALVFIVIVYSTALRHNRRLYEQEQNYKIMMEHKKEQQQYQRPTSKTKPKSNEVIDTLDWMLMNSIITPEEYTKLMGKCLPFIQ